MRFAMRFASPSPPRVGGFLGVLGSLLELLRCDLVLGPIGHDPPFSVLTVLPQSHVYQALSYLRGAFNAAERGLRDEAVRHDTTRVREAVDVDEGRPVIA